jgi:hypothetical protein
MVMLAEMLPAASGASSASVGPSTAFHRTRTGKGVAVRRPVGELFPNDVPVTRTRSPGRPEESLMFRVEMLVQAKAPAALPTTIDPSRNAKTRLIRHSLSRRRHRVARIVSLRPTWPR